MQRLPLAMIGSALGLLLHGCGPTCPQVCSKVLDCEFEGVSTTQTSCEASCESQEVAYEDEGATDKLEAFDDHKACVMDAACNELEEGACYDERIFPF